MKGVFFIVALVVLDDFLDHGIYFCLEVLRLFEAIGDLTQRFGHNGIIVIRWEAIFPGYRSVSMALADILYH